MIFFSINKILVCHCVKARKINSVRYFSGWMMLHPQNLLPSQIHFISLPHFYLTLQPFHMKGNHTFCGHSSLSIRFCVTFSFPGNLYKVCINGTLGLLTLAIFMFLFKPQWIQQNSSTTIFPLFRLSSQFFKLGEIFHLGKDNKHYLDVCIIIT